MVSNLRVVQPLGQIYQLTGRADYLDVLRDAVNTPPATNLNVAAAHHAVAHPHADQTPPAAITDLSAEALGDGKVKLTWTAPGDDGTTGTAAWYQVKYSTTQIVERVSGWPDLTEPLPVDEQQWHHRAESFNAKQRAFWAASNVDGEPTPSRAGTREVFIVDELGDGVYHFAVKAWDDSPNVSGLSNVVEVKAK